LHGRLLVTGASGFVGAHLLPALVASGYEVVAPVRRAPAPRPGVTFPIIDSIEIADWRALLVGVDAVVHLAGLAHARGAPDAAYERINAQATLALARASAGRVGRLVFVSSIRAITGPLADDRLDENSPARPSDAYGRSKLKAEMGLATLALPATILRPVVVYGAGVKGNLARLLRLADSPLPLPFARLRAARSFLSVENVIEAIKFSLRAVTGGIETFVVADPAPTCVAELIGGLREGLGRGERQVGLPNALLGLAARLAGQGESWAALSGPLAVSPHKLLDAGWSPPVATTRQGARMWGESVVTARKP